MCEEVKVLTYSEFSEWHTEQYMEWRDDSCGESKEDFDKRMARIENLLFGKHLDVIDDFPLIKGSWVPK